ncbi:hypothetical protein L7F22_066978 [Adiantum nelumboides]|nr:hypothetical protein [Adiantum nelumboides]
MAGDPFPTALAKAAFFHFDIIAGVIVTLIYPLIASIRAIEADDKLYHKQWLTFWIVYSFVTIVELSLWRILYWIPFWGLIKVVGGCWLVLPQFNGAAYIYDYYVGKDLFRSSRNTSQLTPIGTRPSAHMPRVMGASTSTSVDRPIYRM